MYSGDRLLAAPAAGVLTGLGLALIYTAYSSAGGMDFITVSIKYRCTLFHRVRVEGRYGVG